MYADRFAGDRRFHPAGLVAAVGINAAVVAALMIAVPHVTRTFADPPLITENILLPQPPEPIPPEPQPRTAAAQPERIETVTPRIAIPTDDSKVVFDPLPPIPGPTATGTAAGDGSGSAIAPPAPPIPAPVIVAPGLDPRYAGESSPIIPRRNGGWAIPARSRCAC
jgi:protein TonB